MGNFSYNSNGFLLNGNDFSILSGAIHYFRVVPEYWYDRLEKLKQCGMNTVETYTCWNLHERKQGQFDFNGILDLGRFIDTAAELGLYCILRPGPFICAEFDFGGFPSWLLTEKDVHLRCNSRPYIDYLEIYLEKIIQIIKPRLITNGGNVIMVQVENEYGSFGNDHSYIKKLADFYKEKGIDVPLFTSDGPSNFFYGGGTLPELLATGNFGSHYKDAFGFMKNYYPQFPLMCTEFWNGWFDNWYDPHHRREPDDVAEEFDGMLSMNGNVNFYMFCGGTNFGFTNGANMYEKYSPITTSYDYDAILTEAGDITPRYMKIRSVVEKHFGKLPPLTVKNTAKRSYGEVKLNYAADLFDNLSMLSAPNLSVYPKSMEELGADFGYVLYSTTVDYPISDELIIDNPRDRAIIFLNGKPCGVKERDRQNDKIIINILPGESLKIDILVENLGRVNYGPQIGDNKKGVVNGVRIGHQYLFGWTCYPLTMDNLSKLNYIPVADIKNNKPCFYKGVLNISDKPCDSFLRLEGFEKGFVVINGFNIGRYWNSAGPQKTLYVPAPLLKCGENIIQVFELHQAKGSVCFCDTPNFD